MALIKCPDCGKQFSEYADCCPVCGYPTADIKASMQNATPINNTENSHVRKLSDANQEEKVVSYQQVESHYDKGDPENSPKLANVNQDQPRKKKFNWKLIIILALLGGLIGFIKGYIQEYGIPFMHSNSKEATATNKEKVSIKPAKAPLTEKIENEQNELNDYNYGTEDNLTIEEKKRVAKSVEVLKEWNYAHNNHDAEEFDKLYSGTTYFYTYCCWKSQIIEAKRNLFEKYPDFSQYVDNVAMSSVNDFYIDIRFDKHVKTNNNDEYKTYPSHLMIYKVFEEEKYLIESETDEVTDEIVKQKAENAVKIVVKSNSTISDIFCSKNVGKYLKVCYQDLAFDVNGNEKETADLADSLLSFFSSYGGPDGFLKRNYMGKKGTYYCDYNYKGVGIVVYNSETGEFIPDPSIDELDESSTVDYDTTLQKVAPEKQTPKQTQEEINR